MRTLDTLKSAFIVQDLYNMDTQTDGLVLESLSTGIPTLTKAKADMLKEACVWCLLNCDHESGVPIECTICDENNCLSIQWNDNIDVEGIRKAYNLDDAVEFGAEAIALLLIREKTEYTTGASKNENFKVIFLPVIWTLSLKSI